MRACIYAPSCPILCNPMDCNPLGSSVHGVFQARTLEWVSVPFSRGSSNPGIGPASLVSPALAGGFFLPLAPPIYRKPCIVKGNIKKIYTQGWDLIKSFCFIKAILKWNLHGIFPQLVHTIDVKGVCRYQQFNLVFCTIYLYKYRHSEKGK